MIGGDSSLNKMVTKKERESPPPKSGVEKELYLQMSREASWTHCRFREYPPLPSLPIAHSEPGCTITKD